MSRLLPAHVLLAAAALGLVASLALRFHGPAAPLLLGGVAGALVLPPTARLAGAAVLLALVGWWWGGVRLEALDRSSLRSEVGRAGRTLVEVTGEPRVGQFSQ